MDVSPNQLVSVAASLIPFLENDDANRALMGSNMQRQAVPLIRTRSPLVGTGIEGIVARDSGVTVVAKRDGVVESVDATRIVVRPTQESESDPLSAKPDIYNLTKFQRSNQNTCINQKPIVERGDHVQKGDVIADGPATERGELALGRERAGRVHALGRLQLRGLDPRLRAPGQERPLHLDPHRGVRVRRARHQARQGRDHLRHPERRRGGPQGPRRVGHRAHRRRGASRSDILVGKITPKGETQLSPEEKLLRAIFGEKAGDVRDSSLRVPPGVQGIVISAKVFSRKGTEKDERAKDIEDAEKEKLLADQRDEVKIVSESYYAKMRKLLVGKTTAVRLVDDKGKVLCAKGQKIDERARSTRSRRATGRSCRSRRRGKTEEKLEQLAARLAEDVGAPSRRSTATRSPSSPRATSSRRASSRWSRSTSPSSASCRSATRWPAATATRASSRASCPRRTCRTSPTARRSTSCSTRWACRRA